MRSPDSAVPLAPFTTLGVGGPARWFAEATAIDDVREADDWARDRGVELVILAGGSNVVISDAGIEALVLRMSVRGVSHVLDGDEVVVTAGAGEAWDDLVAWSVTQGLSGIECLSGIPGTVGGTPIQNVGAYGQDVSASIEAVTVFDRQTRTPETLSGSSCRFAYRSSRFKTDDAGRFVVCNVTFRLRRLAPSVKYPDLQRYLDERKITKPAVRDVRDAVIAVRKGKGMVIDGSDVDTSSVGSFFTNPVVPESLIETLASRSGERVPGYAAGEGRVKVPAAWLLERAGLSRGYGIGTVGLSSKHPLAVINRGGASAAEVVTFAAGLKRRVEECFGISLVPEPTFLGFDATDDVRYLMGRAA